MICPVCSKKYNGRASLNTHLLSCNDKLHKLYKDNLKNEILNEYENPLVSITDLSKKFNISKPTIKKYLLEVYSYKKLTEKADYLHKNKKVEPWNKGKTKDTSDMIMNVTNKRIKAGKYKVSLKVRKQISDTLKRRNSNGEIIHWTKLDPERAARIFAISGKKTGKALKKKWAEDKDFAHRMLKNIMIKPNKKEKEIIDFKLKNVEYTGDGTFWIYLPDGRHKNPDFVVRPFHITKKVIEYFGCLNYFHTKDEGKNLIKMYRKIGVDCLLIYEDEFKSDKELVRNNIISFVKRSPSESNFRCKTSLYARTSYRDNLQATDKGASETSCGAPLNVGEDIVRTVQQCTETSRNVCPPRNRSFK